MKFHYKAQKADGTFYEGEREATDKFALSHELKGQGETLISALEEGERMHIDWGRMKDLFGRVSIHDKIIFARNMGGMVGAGLPLSRAIGVLERQTRNQKFKKIIATLGERTASGETLSAALAGFPSVFPAIFASMVKAGEESGNLSNSLMSVADQLDRSYLLQRKIKGALIYPSIVVSVMVIIGVLMFIFVVPGLTDTFREFNVDLPLSTRIVIGISDFLKANLLLGVAGVALAIAGLFAAAKSQKGKRAIDFALLHIPLISPLIKEANAARTGQTLASLLSAGVEVVNALQITANILPNSYYKNVLLKAREAIQRGEPMSAVFREHEDVYAPALSEMMAVGEETGKLSTMLREIGNFFEGEVDQKTKDLSTIIEPLLMVVVGISVGFFAVAMISPAYSLMNSI